MQTIKSLKLKKRYGPTALITGASSGIGREFAFLLAANGFDLLLTARRRDLLASLKLTLEEQYNITVTIYTTDLANLDALEKLCHAINEQPINLLISNAGFGLKGSFHNDDPQRQLDMLMVNTASAMKLARTILPNLVAEKRGGIIFTGSMEGENPFPFSTVYAASKAFLHSLGSSLWFEYKKQGIDILVLAPGATDTEAPILQGINREQLVGLMPAKRVAQEALKALGRGPIWMPGWFNRLFIRGLRFLPKTWAIHIAGHGMAKAINS